MPTVISVVSTKGGIGKTTSCANLAGVLAGLGMRVLMIDADIQPSLSKYYPLLERAPLGLSSVIRSGGSIAEEAISKTSVPRLDIIYSDAGDGSLQDFLVGREDRSVILRRAVRSPSPIVQRYNVIIIDTQGAGGKYLPLQKTAAMAADYMLSPVKPDILSTREFASGTLDMLEELNRLSDMGLESGELFALINDQERTNNSREIANAIRREFVGHKKVRVLNTVIPHATAYPSAATNQIPVHEYDRRPDVKGSAYRTMHELVWELFPELNDITVDDVVSEEEHPDEERPREHDSSEQQPGEIARGNDHEPT